MAAQPVSLSLESETKLRSSSNGDAIHEKVRNVDPSQDGLSDEDANIFASNPFSDPKVAEHYRGIYEKADYECRHVFNPELEWSPKEEKKLLRKLDWHVAFTACLLFFALNVDRGNIKQALSDDMLSELGLSTDDYNYGQTIFYVSFLLAEVPSQLISKRVGPDVWIPTQMVLWSAVAAGQAGLRGRSSFFACRSLLGILEGGFIPDLVLWLSYFYKSGELSLRLSFFWVSSNLTVVITAFMAYGLLHMRGVAGLSGWRWLFLIEGLITLCIGIAAYFLMPASAVQTKTWYRPHGWFTDREVGIVVNRVLRDDPSKGDMNNREGITPRRLWDSLMDYDLWLIYAIGLIVYIPYSPPTYYLTLSLRSLGFNPFTTNLLSIPPQIIGCFTLVAITWVSERLGERNLVAMFMNIWILPCLLALRIWTGSRAEPWNTYALLTVLLSYPYCHAIVVGLASRNSGSVRTRSISAAVYNMFVQTGNIVSSNIYRQDDSPLYHRGNSTLIGLDILAIILFIATKLYYVLRNRYRKRRWDEMSAEEREDYLKSTTDEGNKRLDFRFTH